MQVLSFQPFGAAVATILPAATEFRLSRKVHEAYIPIFRAASQFDPYGDVSPIDLQDIDIPFQVGCNDQAQLDALRLAFATRGTLKCFQIDGTLRQTTFKATDFSVNYSWQSKFIDVLVHGKLTPYWRSIFQQSKSVVNTSPLTLTTLGNASVYDSLTLLFTASASVGTLQITNSTNGYTLSINASLSIGQTVTINVPAVTVLKSGGSDLYPATTTGSAQIGLFKLAPGANSIALNPTNKGTLLVTWRDTWL